MSEDAAAWVEYVTRPRINADPSVAVATKQRADAANAVRAMLEPDAWPGKSNGPPPEEATREVADYVWGERQRQLGSASHSRGNGLHHSRPALGR